MKYLIPLLLLVACGNPKADIVKRIQAERDSVSKYRLRASEIKLEVQRAYHAKDIVTNADIEKVSKSKEMDDLRTEALYLDLNISRSKRRIDSLELALKAY